MSRSTPRRPQHSPRPPRIQQAGVASSSFDGSGLPECNDCGGSIADYKWDFGDRSAIDDTGATATDSHTYASAGIYTVALTVTDDLGVTSTTTQTVTLDQPTASFSAT